MKKLRLNFTQSVGEILTREELKSITGGDLGGSGKPAYEAFNGYTIIRGVNKETALAMINGQSGAKWCCDSCGSASWY